ncbi:MAG: hypothetical protein Q9213_008382 [Squamulea squamosa]
MIAFLQVLLSFPFAAPQPNRSCKAHPETLSWPSEAQWINLNTSVSGQLLSPLPAAAVCDSSLPVFHNDTCTSVASQWSVSDFHANDPMSMMQPNWENDACLPEPNVRCDLKQYPRYVLNATKPAHVKAAIDFARTHNVRLIVRGTGHDFLGRLVYPWNGHLGTDHLIIIPQVYRAQLSVHLDAQHPWPAMAGPFPSEGMSRRRQSSAQGRCRS